MGSNRNVWKNRIRRTGICFLTVLSCILSGCQATEKTDREETGSSLPVLHIGVDRLNPFFYVDENGEYSGIDAEIAEEACKRAGYQPDFKELDWSDRDTSLQDGSVDCVWSGFIKNGREEAYQWTQAYMQSNLRILVDKQSPDTELASFNGKRGVAVRAGSKIEELLLKDSSQFSDTPLYSCGTFEMAETAFVKGYAGALGGHEVVLQQVMQSHPGMYRFLDGIVLNADLAVAFCKGNTSEKYEKINGALTEMKEDGTIQEILDHYDLEEPSSQEEGK